MTRQTDAPPGRPATPLLLLTKLHPPVVLAQAVVRQRLFERLRDGRGRRLSLVACPAGFGKSTLLAAWLEVESVKEFDGPHLLPAASGWEEVADYALSWALEHAVQPSRT